MDGGEGMSITDELRKWANHSSLSSWTLEVLTAIADRIDAEHERGLLKAQAEGIDMGFASADDWLADHEDAMEEHGWIRLPVDADGVPINLGDVMEWPTTGETFEVVGIGDGTLFYVEDGNECADWTGASTKRHHHAPTVEDVLREFADRVCNSGHQWGLDAADTIAEYAAKLQLRGDAE